MRGRTGLAAFLCLTLVAGFGQTRKQERDSLRSINVHQFREYFFCWPVIKQRSTAFEFRTEARTGQTVKFKPNSSFHAGLGMYLFEIGFEVTFALPMESRKKYLYGESDAKDLQAHVLGKNWGADLFVSDYRGFYKDDSANPVPKNQPYPQRPDIRTHNIGVNGIYIFRQNKFSLRTAYNFAERQRKSGGSFSLSGSFNRYRVTADSAVLSKKYDAVFGRLVDFRRLGSTTFSLAPGYTYTVIVRNFFINTSFGFGPAFNWVNYKLSSGEEFPRNSFSSFIDFRAAIGYNGDRFFTGVSLVSQSRSIHFETTDFISSSTTFKIVMGYRFREYGILKKRALDLLPFGAK